MSDQNKTLTFEEAAAILRVIEATPRGGEVKLQLGEASLHVRLKGPGAGDGAPVAPAAAAPAAVGPAPASATPAAAPAVTGPAPAAPVPGEGALDIEGLVPINSPLAGIFYRAPAPGAPAFVEEGDEVEEGQQVGIIEVMKLMNRIVAPCNGTVRRICVANEALAEFGATLMWIEPRAGETS